MTSAVVHDLAKHVGQRCIDLAMDAVSLVEDPKEKTEILLLISGRLIGATAGAMAFERGLPSAIDADGRVALYRAVLDALRDCCP